MFPSRPTLESYQLPLFFQSSNSAVNPIRDRLVEFHLIAEIQLAMIPTSPASGTPTTRVSFEIFDGSFSLISSLVFHQMFLPSPKWKWKGLVRKPGVFYLVAVPSVHSRNH